MFWHFLALSAVVLRGTSTASLICGFVMLSILWAENCYHSTHFVPAFFHLVPFIPFLAGICGVSSHSS